MRIVSIDRTRGVLMAVMAIDHASFFIRKVHFTEGWGLPIPAYEGWAEFLTRFVTYPAPTGFLFLMGVGIALGAHKRTALHYLGRGGLILLLHFLLEPLLWILVSFGADFRVFRLGEWPGSGGPVSVEFGVLFVLGMGYMIWGLCLVYSKRKAI